MPDYMENWEKILNLDFLIIIVIMILFILNLKNNMQKNNMMEPQYLK